MLRRLMGLLLIFSILMPIILGAAGFFVMRQFVADIENAVRGPLDEINAGLEDVKATVDDATQAFRGLSGRIAAIANTLGGIGRAITAVTTRLGPISIPNISVRLPVIGRVTIPVPDIPSFSVPGLAELKSILSSIFGVFNDLTDVVRRVASIGQLPERLNRVVDKATTLVNDVSDVVARWLDTLTAIAIVFLIWVAAVYIALVYRWLSSGWQMLRGLPA
ncbi:MAG TPA: hypothetical protein VJ793_14520 [Anaerolineae bacterium]|nr:hypothetical protein [Anaerolineae bacterium]